MSAIPTGLIGEIGARVRAAVAHPTLSDPHHRVRVAVMQFFLARGRGAAADELAATLPGTKVEEVTDALAVLARAGVLQLASGVVDSAYPFSSSPSRHRVEFVDGRSCFALCATDALGIHYMTGDDLTTVSRCPACESEVVCRLEQGVLLDVAPDSAIQYISLPPTQGEVVSSACPNMNLFCSPQHLDDWLAQAGQAEWRQERHTPAQVAQHGAWIFGDFIRR